MDFYTIKAFFRSIFGGYYFLRCYHCNRYHSGGEDGGVIYSAFEGQSTCARPSCMREVAAINERNRPGIQAVLDRHYGNQP